MRSGDRAASLGASGWSAHSGAAPGGRVLALDGLRGAAVILVTASHANWPVARMGGTVGVTVFFVLSGYLITTLLRREQAGTGRVGLVRFYQRRALRLLPALAVVLVAGCVLAVALDTDTPSTVLAAAGTCLVYIANLFPWTGIDPGPFGHLWSLSMEEQFYLLWPAALLLLRRARPRQVVVGLLVASAVSLALRFGGGWSTGAEYEVAFYMPHTNVWALFVGCAVAVAIEAGWRPQVSSAWVAGATALILLVSTVAGMRTGLRETAEPLTYLLRLLAGPVGALGAVVLVAGAATASPAVRWLEHRGLVWFGRVSYGLYLWHAILDDVLTQRWGDTPARGVLTGTVAAGLAVGAAALSFRWVEAPALRLNDRLGSAEHPSPEPAPAPATP